MPRPALLRRNGRQPRQFGSDAPEDHQSRIADLDGDPLQILHGTRLSRRQPSPTARKSRACPFEPSCAKNKSQSGRSFEDSRSSTSAALGFCQPLGKSRNSRVSRTKIASQQICRTTDLYHNKLDKVRTGLTTRISRRVLLEQSSGEVHGERRGSGRAPCAKSSPYCKTSPSPAPLAYPKATVRATRMAGFSRSCAITDSGTSVSVSTRASAVSGLSAEGAASSRPSEKLAMLIWFCRAPPDMADNPRHVVVLEVQQVAGEQRFALDPLGLHQPRAIQDHGAFDAGDARIGLQFDHQRIDVAMPAFVPLGDTQAALPRQLHRVHHVGPSAQGAVQDAGQSAVADDLGVHLGHRAAIANPHRLAGCRRPGAPPGSPAARPA